MQPTAVRRAAVGGFESTVSKTGVVLLVTGDGELCEAASRVLRSEGYQVLAAAHAGHAILACLKAPRVDVAVIEIAMDDMSGPALAERLRRHNPGLRAVYIAQPGARDCDGVLVRPFTREDLLAQLSLTLANS